MIQGFIFNWKGHEADARALEEQVERYVKVVVINSEEQLKGKYPKWIHLDDTAYFSAQWNKAIELFDADIFFHIQADVHFDHFDRLITRARSLFEKHRLGVYEPNIDFTDIEYDISKLRSIDSELFEVPTTDCTCWFIDGSIVRKLPPVDVSVNKYGWGIPRAIASLCRLNKKLCVRDYSFTLKHPKSRGYPSSLAMRQLENYIRGLSPEIQKEVQRLQKRRERVRSMTH